MATGPSKMVVPALARAPRRYDSLEEDAFRAEVEQFMRSLAAIPEELGELGDHGDLAGLGDDDHTQYTLVDGSRAFTGVISGVTPTAGSHLATKGYVDGVAAGGTLRDLLDVTLTPTVQDEDFLVYDAGGAEWRNRKIIAADLPSHSHDAGDITTGLPWTVAEGGTGRTSLTANALLVGAGTSAVGLLAGSAAENEVAVNAGNGVWEVRQLAASDIHSGVFGTVRGGTGRSTYTTGDLLYSNATNTLAQLGIGSDGQVLRVSGGLPVWGAVPTHTHDAADITSGTLAKARLPAVVAYEDESNTFTLEQFIQGPTGGGGRRLTIRAQDATSLVTEKDSPTLELWGSWWFTDTVPNEAANLAFSLNVNVTGSGVVGTGFLEISPPNLPGYGWRMDEDGNVDIAGDLSVAGTLTANLPAHTHSTADITTGLPWTVAEGGTGRTSLTANALLVGAGTSAVSLLAGSAAEDEVAINAGSGVWEVRQLGTSDIHSGVLTEVRGGTGNNAYTIGDLLYSDAAGSLARLAIGGAGQVLQVSSGVPVWAAVPSHSHDAGDVTSGAFAKARLPSSVAYEDESNTFTLEQIIQGPTDGGGRRLTIRAQDATSLVTEKDSPTLELWGSWWFTDTVPNEAANLPFSLKVNVTGSGVVGTGFLEISPPNLTSGYGWRMDEDGNVDIAGDLSVAGTFGPVDSLIVNSFLGVNAAQFDSRQMLLVLGNTNSDAWIGLRPGGTANNAEIHFYESNFGLGNIRGRIRYEVDNEVMEFWTANSVRATINNAGAFILGTDPSGTDLLRVGGTARFNGDVTILSGSDLIIMNGAIDTGANDLLIKRNGSTRITVTGTTVNFTGGISAGAALTIGSSTYGPTSMDVAGQARCNSLRIDQTPTTGCSDFTVDGYFPISLNGTEYYVPLRTSAPVC